MATFALVSSSNALSVDTAVISDLRNGLSTVTDYGFFGINVGKAGVTITKASTLKGAQTALTMPLSLKDAQDLTNELVRLLTP
jgi:hypothetical protein